MKPFTKKGYCDVINEIQFSWIILFRLLIQVYSLQPCQNDEHLVNLSSHHLLLDRVCASPDRLQHDVQDAAPHSHPVHQWQHVRRVQSGTCGFLRWNPSGTFKQPFRKYTPGWASHTCGWASGWTTCQDRILLVFQRNQSTQKGKLKLHEKFLQIFLNQRVCIS